MKPCPFLLRIIRRKRPAAPLTFGQRLADGFAATVGSWWFISIQTLILMGWLYMNVAAHHAHWDPYPFILLNLALSFQAAYACPIIMMSQNRQAQLDRRLASADYAISLKAELGIEHLQVKIEEMHQRLLDTNSSV